MASLGSLELQMSMNVARLESDVKKASRMVQRMGDDLRNIIGGISLVYLTNQFKSFVETTIDTGDRLNDLRTRTGLTGNELILLEGAAVRGGQSLEAISDVASKLGKRFGAAELETSEAGRALDAMGMSARDSEGRLKSVGQILAESGEKFKTYRDGLDKSSLALALFGKGGDRMIPVVEGLNATRDAFKRLGITISEEFITNSDKYKDALADIKSVNDVFARQLVTLMLPTMVKFAESWAEMAADKGRMQQKIELITNVVKGLSVAFYGVITSLELVGMAVGKYAAVIVTLWTDGPIAAFKSAARALDDLSEKGRTAGLTMKKILDFDPAGDADDPVKKLQSLLDKVQKEQADAAKKDPPKIVDPAVASKYLKQLEDAQKALMDLRSAQSDNMISVLKQQLQHESQLLDMAHAANLISEHEFWDKKTQIMLKEFDEEYAIMNARINEQMALLVKIDKTTLEGQKDYFEKQKKIEEMINRRNMLETAMGQASKVNYQNSQIAADAYADSVAALNVRLLETQGNTVEAARLRRELETRQLTLKHKDDPAAMAMITRNNELLGIQDQMNEQKEQYDIINGNMLVNEERIQRTLKTGAISELTALQQIGTERQKAVAQMEALVASYQQLAAASGDPRMKLQAAQLSEQLEKLRSESDLLGEKFRTLAESTLSNFFTDLMDKSKTTADAFRNFGLSIIKTLNDIAAKELATRILGKDGLGIFGSGGGSSGGGIFGSIAGFFGKVFGGGVSAAPTSNFDHYATGTPFVPHTGLAIVHQGERIVTASENNTRYGKGMNITVSPVFNITGPVTKETQAQIASGVFIASQRAASRMA